MLVALGPAQERAYQQTLHGVHTRRIVASLLDRQGRTIAWLSPAFRSGAVTVDARQDVTRSAQLDLLDPWHRLGFDADTYQGGLLDLSRMVRLVYCVNSPLLAEEVRIGVFKGPVTRIRRDGPMLSVEAQGMEVYGLNPAQRSMTIGAGTRKTDAIKQILRDLMGVVELGGIPNLRAKLPDDVTITQKDRAFKVAWRIADAMNRQLFFDGNGRPQLRRRPKKVGWSFHDGPGGGLTSPLRTEADMTKVKNHIEVKGATKGGKTITGQATAAANHPLSPWNLGLPGGPLYLTEEVTNDHLRSQQEVDEYAADLLERRLRLIHDASFNSVPVPHLDPLDLIRVHTAYESVSTQLETFTLPLALEGDMSVGYVDPYRLKRTGRPHKRRRHGGRFHATEHHR
jgi:hypothetical protein